jgi:uncharacterized protein YhbP (UPF0306 family)
MNKTEKQLDRIAQLLRQQTTLSLATSGEDGQPCLAPLFYLVDESLSLYWLSSPSSLHSRNLLRTPHAAAAVYCAAQNWREIRGVQIRGSVSILTEPRRRDVLTKSYCQRFNLGRVLRLAVRQSVLHILMPEFFRYIENSRGFGSKFELARTPQGWSSTCPPA